MTTLEPTPDLLAAARRVASREWIVREDESGYPTDPHLARLFDAQLVVLHYPPTRLTDDRWALTGRGVAWLAEHDREAP